MDSGRLVFDSSAMPHGQILLFGGGNSIFREARGMKRPFLTSPDELWEEEYYDDHHQEKKRRLTAEQVVMLEKSFEEENKLEPERKTELAKKLGLQPRQVAIWFQNRRARWKNKQMEHDYDILKAEFDSLRAQHNSVAQENDRLRTQVVELTDKLLANGIKPDEKIANFSDSRITISDQSSPPAAQLHVGAKAEDRLSAGTTGSGIVDLEGTQHCGDSYFKAGIGELRFEEEDGLSDEGCSLFPQKTVFKDQNFGDDLGIFWDWNN